MLNQSAVLLPRREDRPPRPARVPKPGRDGSGRTPWAAWPGRGQWGARGARPPGASRTAALRYASWGWPLTPDPRLAPTTDLEQVFAAWTRLPDAPILAACGSAFEAVRAPAEAGRAALVRLDRLCIPVGPVLQVGSGAVVYRAAVDRAAADGDCARPDSFIGRDGLAGLSELAELVEAAGRDGREGRDGRNGYGPAGPGAAGQIAFLVRPGSARRLERLLGPDPAAGGPGLLGEGDFCELPPVLATADPGGPVRWLRLPAAARPPLPPAQAVLGALALSAPRPGRRPCSG